MKAIKRTNLLVFFTVLAMGSMLLAGCGKDDSSQLIGKWTNTAQSYVITIAGQENIPEGYICMEFTSSKVWISDSRTNCLPEWHKYTLSKKDGKQLIEFEGGCCDGLAYVVDELTDDKLVLSPKSNGIDWDCRYIMKRY